MISPDEQTTLMLKVNVLLNEWINEVTPDDEQQLAIAGMLMRYSIALYRGVIEDHELEELLGYVSEKLEQIPEVSPQNRNIH